MTAKRVEDVGAASEPQGRRSRFWMGARWSGMMLACAVVAAGAYWLVQRSGRPEELQFSPSIGQAEAETLVNRMLATNRVWLHPQPVRATYCFKRKATSWSLSHLWDRRIPRPLRQHDEEEVGPFTARWKSDETLRVGAMVYTPLGAMLDGRGNYSVQPVGKARWHGKEVVAVDITFLAPAGGRVGMGAGRTGYSSAGYEARVARILIDPAKAVPLYISTLGTGVGGPKRPGDSSFEFDPDFLPMTGGYAPRALVWRRPDLSWSTRFEYQTTNGYWFFKRGKANIKNDRWSHFTQEVELTRLDLQPLRPGDLLQEYPAQVPAGDPAPARARPWRFGPEDIFKLSQFNLEVGKELKVKSGAADLGIGYCEDGAVWAVLIPRGDGALSSMAVPQSERPGHVWLRFHPGQVGRLFPPEILSSDGNEQLRAKMCAIANMKMLSSWSADGMATIPEPQFMTVDVDTVEGVRRMFEVNTQTGSAKYSPQFEASTVNLSPEALEVMSEPVPDHRKELAKQALNTSSPKVLSVSPAPGAEGVPADTELRIRFERPMEPRALKLDWDSGDCRSVDFPAYDSNRCEFTVPVHLVPGVLHQLVVNKEGPGSFGSGFVSADGKPARMYVWRFSTAKESGDLGSAAGNAGTSRNGEQPPARGSGSERELLSLLQRMQQRRAGITSLVERVQTISQFHGPGLRELSVQGATFAWQGNNQYYGDVSQIMGGVFRIGCDGKAWWWQTGSFEKPDLALCPINDMQVKDVSIADPFGLSSDSAATAVKNLGLELVGRTNWAGRDYFVIEARPGRLTAEPGPRWWVDSQELLLTEQDTGGYRTRFQYELVNGEVPTSVFSPIRSRDVKPQGPEELDATYAQRFVNLRDGSDGRMSARWGKFGPKARSSSGLN